MDRSSNQHSLWPWGRSHGVIVVIMILKMRSMMLKEVINGGDDEEDDEDEEGYSHYTIPTMFVVLLCPSLSETKKPTAVCVKKKKMQRCILVYTVYDESLWSEEGQPSRLAFREVASMNEVILSLLVRFYLWRRPLKIFPQSMFLRAFFRSKVGNLPAYIPPKTLQNYILK